MKMTTWGAVAVAASFLCSGLAAGAPAFAEDQPTTITATPSSQGHEQDHEQDPEETPKPDPDPVKPADLVTTTYGDWTLDCEGGLKTRSVTVTTTGWKLEGHGWVQRKPVTDATVDREATTVYDCPVVVPPVVVPPVVVPPVVIPPKPDAKIEVADDHWTKDCEAGFKTHIVTTAVTEYVLVDNVWVLGTPVVTHTEDSFPTTADDCKTTTPTPTPTPPVVTPTPTPPVVTPTPTPPVTTPTPVPTKTPTVTPTTPATAPAVPVSNNTPTASGQLAHTGSDTPVALWAGAGVLLLLGAALTFIGSRRRAASQK